MKRLSYLHFAAMLFITAISFSCSRVSAQKEHFEFMDISMGQDIDKFTDALKDKGFEFITKEGEVSIMKGSFSGSAVEIGIFETPQTKQVAMVMVEFPTNADKKQARGLYDQYGELLDKKYGNCQGKNTQFFPHLIEQIDPSTITNGTIGDYGTYFVSFKPKLGEVAMRVYNTSQFQIVYADSVNFVKGLEEVKSKMGSDL